MSEEKAKFEFETFGGETTEDGTKVQWKVLYELVKREHLKVAKIFNESFKSLSKVEDKNVLKTAQMFALAVMLGDGRLSVKGDEERIALDVALMPLLSLGKQGMVDTMEFLRTETTPQEEAAANLTTAKEGEA